MDSGYFMDDFVGSPDETLKNDKDRDCSKH